MFNVCRILLVADDGLFDDWPITAAVENLLPGDVELDIDVLRLLVRFGIKKSILVGGCLWIKMKSE